MKLKAAIIGWLIGAIVAPAQMPMGGITFQPSSSNTYTLVHTFIASNCSGTPASCAASINTGSTGSGNLIVMFVVEYGGGALGNVTKTVSMSGGGTYTYVSSPGFTEFSASTGQFSTISAYYTCSSSSGATTVTATIGAGGGSNMMMSGAEYSYSGGICALNNSVASFNTGSSTTTATVAANANDQLVGGSGSYSGGGWTAGNDGSGHNYTMRVSPGNWCGLEDLSNSASGSYSASITGGNHVGLELLDFKL
jgi:hypothetical protein